MITVPALAENPRIDVQAGTDMRSTPIAIDYRINDTGTGHVILEILTPDNRSIKTIDCGIKSNGSYAAIWDGSDDNGTMVPRGNYSVKGMYTPNEYAVKSAWGGFGSADGQLKRPSDIAVDGDGYVYVAEYDNHRIQKFDSSGRFVCAWGSYGSGDGQFEYPSGITVSGQGIVYVVDYGNSRVEMFSTDGGYVGQWGSKGSSDGQFNMPHGIAVDSNGNVYIADMGNHRVEKFSANGKFIGSWGDHGKDGRLLSPIDVAVEGDTIFVTDIDRNVVNSYTPDGEFLNSLGSQGSEVQFKSPYSIAVDNGNVYVSDVGNNRVQKFHMDGSYQGMLDGFNMDVNGPVTPTGIALDGTGNVYVTDFIDNRVLKLSPDPLRENMIVENSTNISIETEASVVGLGAVSGAPVTAISLTGTTGNNSWYRSNVTVTLTPFDNSGSGIRGTYYNLDNKTWIPYILPFNITDNGTTTIRYYSIDNEGNTEAVQWENARIDMMPPTVTGTATTDPVANGWYKDTVTVHFNASDTLSGVINITPDETISTSGHNVIIGTATDMAGNVGTVAVHVNIDNDPPVTTCSLKGTSSGDWFTSDVQVSFNATDNDGSGAANTEYSLDGGTWKSAASFIINKEGLTTVYYRTTDAVGNVEDTKTSAVKIDKTSPTITGSPDRAPDKNGWYMGDVTVHFNAVDAYSDIASVTEDKTLTDDGAYQSVIGIATDKAGNTASTVVGGINIDKNPPVTTCTLDGLGGGTGDNIWYRTDVGVTLSATDAGCGVKNMQYSWDHVTWLDYHPFIISNVGMTTFYYRSIDNLDIVEPYKTMTVRIDKTPPDVQGHIITQPNGNGWYTDTVIIHFTANDAQSGVGSISPDIYLSSDGPDQYVTGYASDMAGNQGLCRIGPLDVDVNAPVTSCVLNRTPNEDGWFNGDVSATISASDNNGKGMNITKYSRDGKNWNTYTAPIVFHDEGANVLYYYSTDSVDHVEAINAKNVKIDNTLPTLTYQILGGTPVGNWYTQDVTVHFIAYDAISGIKSVTPDVLLTNDCTGKIVTGSATDMANHTVTNQTTGINIDRNPPKTTCTLSGTTGNNGWYTSSVQVAFIADDGNGIGVDHTEYSLDNNTWTNGSGFTINKDGFYTIYYRSVDRLNNTEAVNSTTCKVDLTPPSLIGVALTKPSGWGWFNSSVTIHFNATDATSGLASVTPDQTLTDDGVGQSVTGQATDNAGNTASYVFNNINIDKRVPVTNYTISGTAGNNGWYKSSVTVNFTVDDVDGGLYQTRHSFDNKNWNADNPFPILGEGTPTIYYYSIDRANNTEAVRNFNVKIDKTAPTVIINANGTGGTSDAFRTNVDVSFNTADTGNNASGIASAEYSLDGTTWKPVANFSLSVDGSYNIQYRASDNAGNNATGSRMIIIDRSIPKVDTITPIDGATGVSVDPDIALKFSDVMDPQSINNSTFSLVSDNGTTVNGNFSFAQNGNSNTTMHFRPFSHLDPYMGYTATLSDGAANAAGSRLAADYSATFTTGNMASNGTAVVSPTIAPTINPTAGASPTPKPGSGGIPIINQIPVIPVLIFLAILAVGGLALFYLTRMRK